MRVMIFCISNIIVYLWYGFTAMITFYITQRIYKNLVNPVLGKRKQHQTGFFSYDVIAFESESKVMLKTFSFSFSRAATLKKEIFNKSTTCFMSLRAMTSRCQPAQQGHNKKIDLVIKTSKQFRFLAGRYLGALSFWFLKAYSILGVIV